MTSCNICLIVVVVAAILLSIIKSNESMTAEIFKPNGFNFPDEGQPQPQPEYTGGTDGGGGGGGDVDFTMDGGGGGDMYNPNNYDPNVYNPQIDFAGIDPNNPDFNELIRQGVINNTLPLPAPNIVTPTTTVSPSSIRTCICVPTGSCNTSTGSIDGTGLIDVRIVTNPNGVLTPAITNTGGTCQTGLVSCCQPGPYQCGKQYPPVAGSPAPSAGQASYGEYPWQAALLGPGLVYIGSGVLIDALNVLTVAHRAATYASAPTTLTVRMGEWNAGGQTEPIPAIDIPVSRIFLNPNFNSGNLKNDVAILRLSRPVTLGSTPTITTACLPTIAYTGQRCWVSGWGRNDFNNGSYQAIQKEIDVPVQSPQTCQSQLAATRLGSSFQFDTSSFICAGGENGKDACTGDGGSPLVCNVANSWYVAGLVAWGIGCGQTNVPGVYVNVLNFVPWIQSTIAIP